MGKGDKKSRKGKISMGSYGVTRPKNKKKVVATASATKKVKPAAEKAAPKKAAPKKASKKVAEE
jgi:30S ribosomal protein S31